MTDNTSGRRWSRFALGFGAVMSILGNETHTVLTPGHLGIVIRVALAAIWPVALFVAVEVLVRVNWREKEFIDWAGRVVMMIPVTVVAAVVSYQHLHALMRLAGEDAVSALIGPVAIDGLMVGGTVALLAIRAASLTATPIQTAPVQHEVSATQPIEPEVDWSGIDWDREMIQMNEPVSIPPVPVIPGPPAPRAPRARWDARRVCELALDGVKAAPASEETGIGQSTYARYLAAARILQSDPRAAIEPKYKVPAEHVAILRELVTR